MINLLCVPFSILSALIAKFILPNISKKLSSVQIGLLGWAFMLTGASSLIFAVYLHHPVVLVLMGAACVSGIGMTLCFPVYLYWEFVMLKPSNME